MLRIAIRHTDADHPNGETFAWRRPFDDLDEALAALPAALAEFPEADGYSHRVEELVVDGDSGEWVEKAAS